MVELRKRWSSEEDFLSKFKMIPKTKNADELLVLKRLGYTLYFEYNNEVIELDFVSREYFNNTYYSHRCWIESRIIDTKKLYISNIDKLNAAVYSELYIKPYYIMYD